LVGVDQDGKGKRDFSFFIEVALGHRLADDLHPALSGGVELGRVRRIFPVFDILHLIGELVRPLLDQGRRIRQDEKNLEVERFADLPGFIELSQVGILIIADVTPMIDAGQAARKDEEHVPPLELRDRHFAALKSGQGEIGHGLHHGNRLDVLRLELSRGG